AFRLRDRTNQSRTVTVFGGTGFLGRRIVRHLRYRELPIRIATEKGRLVSQAAFPVLRWPHISGRFQDLCTGGLSPGRILIGSRCSSGQSRFWSPTPTRWSPISVR